MTPQITNAVEASRYLDYSASLANFDDLVMPVGFIELGRALFSQFSHDDRIELSTAAPVLHKLKDFGFNPSAFVDAARSERLKEITLNEEEKAAILGWVRRHSVNPAEAHLAAANDGILEASPAVFEVAVAVLWVFAVVAAVVFVGY